MTDISKSNWQDIRPSDLKDTGMGGAADKWRAACIAVNRLGNAVALADAGSQNKALQTAISTAQKALEKIKKHKKYQATKDLLDDWETQTDAYAKALATESNNRMQIEVQRIAAANQLKAQQEAANLAAANKVCDKAFEITENYQSTVNGLKKLLKTQVESVQTLAAEVKKNGAKLTLSEGKARLQKLSPEDVRATSLAGESIEARLTRAPWNDEPIGGLKVVARSGWFAARPSGTENVYKIYAESFAGSEHLRRIQTEARELVSAVFAAAAA